MDEDRPAGCVAAFGVTVLVISALFILAFQACSGLNLGFTPTPRKHLAQIPIDRRACPYVVAMHETANAFQSAQPFLGSYLGPGDTVIDVPWPRVRARLRKTLLELQLAILVGRPHFPPAIRRRLTTTLAAIHTGVQQLPRANGTFDLTNKTFAALTKGQAAFGYAGDLVGKQCRVQLGADSNLAQATPQDVAEYSCRRAIGRGKFLNAVPTTVGRLRALRQGGVDISPPRAHAFPGADDSAQAAYCWKRLQYAYVSYAANLGGDATVIATRGWNPRLCKRTAVRPHVCVAPLPAPPPGPPRAGR